MISVIIATRNADLLNQLTANIQKNIGVEHEVIAISGNKPGEGICRIYNEGAARAKFPFLCFMHEDILFHTYNWGKNLIKHLQNKEIALVGILGATIKSKTPSEVFIPLDNLTRTNQMQHRAGKAPEHYYSNPGNETYSEVVVVDGMFLACTKSNHTKYPFDEHLFNGFHGYDIDFSLGQGANGKVVVIYDILIEHFSNGGHSVLWIKDQLILKNKWDKHLPAYLPSSQKSIKVAEVNNIEVFLIDLIVNRYNKPLKFVYLVKLLALRPFSIKNLYYIKKFLVPFLKKSGN